MASWVSVKYAIATYSTPACTWTKRRISTAWWITSAMNTSTCSTASSSSWMAIRTQNWLETTCWSTRNIPSRMPLWIGSILLRYCYLCLYGVNFYLNLLIYFCWRIFSTLLLTLIVDLLTRTLQHLPSWHPGIQRRTSGWVCLHGYVVSRLHLFYAIGGRQVLGGSPQILVIPPLFSIIKQFFRYFTNYCYLLNYHLHCHLQNI